LLFFFHRPTLVKLSTGDRSEDRDALLECCDPLVKRRLKKKEGERATMEAGPRAGVEALSMEDDEDWEDAMVRRLGLILHMGPPYRLAITFTSLGLRKRRERETE
jgi:hypothetical protein